MSTITKKGNKLAWTLAESIGYTRFIAEICSRICRLAKTYHRLQEELCNGYGDLAWTLEKNGATRETVGRVVAKMELARDEKEENIERLIKSYAESLPLVNGQHIGVKFSGDPRGCVVKLIMPDGRTDDFAGEGICVPYRD